MLVDLKLSFNAIETTETRCEASRDTRFRGGESDQTKAPVPEDQRMAGQARSVVPS